jgi:hypothetical protein
MADFFFASLSAGCGADDVCRVIRKRWDALDDARIRVWYRVLCGAIGAGGRDERRAAVGGMEVRAVQAARAGRTASKRK